MKYYSRADLYKAANVTFNPKTVVAYSYAWWRFVEVIDNLVVFNSYQYSNATIKHQYKVRRLLQQLDIPINLIIEAPQGLQDLNSSILHYFRLIQQLEDKIKAPRSHKTKNEERAVLVGQYYEKIVAVRKLIKSQEVVAA